MCTFVTYMYTALLEISGVCKMHLILKHKEDIRKFICVPLGYLDAFPHPE